MCYRFLMVLLLGLVVFHGAATAQSGEGAVAAKEALQEMNDFIGCWKGNGVSDLDKRLIWKEGINWSWRFQKDKDPSLVVTIEKGKIFKKGELRYLAAKKIYELTLEAANGQTRAFQGALKKGKLTLLCHDAESNEKQKLEMSLAGNGERFVYSYWVMPENRTQYNRSFLVGLTREGVTFGAAAKKVECVVTGGLGTMSVVYKGVTYYVCCSGCRDAFNETPEKFIKEYNAKKKGGN